MITPTEILKYIVVNIEYLFCVSIEQEENVYVWIGKSVRVSSIAGKVLSFFLYFREEDEEEEEEEEKEEEEEEEEEKKKRKCGILFCFFSSCPLYSSSTVHSLSLNLEGRLHKKEKNRALAPEIFTIKNFCQKKKKNRNKRPIFLHVSHRDTEKETEIDA